MALNLSNIGGNVFISFNDLNSVFGFLLNLVFYISWAMVFIGISYVLYSVIYKLMNSDNEEAIKEFRGAITKAIIITVLGLLLLSVQALIYTVGSFFDIRIDFISPF